MMGFRLMIISAFLISALQLGNFGKNGIYHLRLGSPNISTLPVEEIECRNGDGISIFH